MLESLAAEVWSKRIPASSGPSLLIFAFTIDVHPVFHPSQKDGTPGKAWLT